MSHTFRIAVGTALLLFAVSAAGDPAVSPSLEIRERLKLYEVRATSAEELHTALNENRPTASDGQRSHALTQTTLETAFTMLQAQDGCQWETAAVTLDMETWLPDLKNDPGDSPEVDEQWEGLLAGLTLHEQGHRDLARSSAQSLLESVRQIRLSADTTSCRHLQRRLAAALDKAMLRLKFRQQRYDQRTDFGAKQGAVLILDYPGQCPRSARRARPACSALVSPTCSCPQND